MSRGDEKLARLGFGRASWDTPVPPLYCTYCGCLVHDSLAATHRLRCEPLPTTAPEHGTRIRATLTGTLRVARDGTLYVKSDKGAGRVIFANCLDSIEPEPASEQLQSNSQDQETSRGPDYCHSCGNYH